MELDQIETFLAIAQLGGFTRAGTRVHRSQPAISRRLRMLESELGAALFERIRGVVRLTDAGRALLPHAQALLAAHNDAREAVQAELRGGSGEITLAVVGTLVDTALCARLARFCRARPDLRLTIRTAGSEEVSQLVRQGDATLGIRYFADAHSEVSCTQIGQEPMVVIAAADHPRLTRGARSSELLASERWLIFPTTKAYKEAFGRVLLRQLSAAGFDRVDTMEVDSTAAQKRLVEAGFGLALLPKSGVADEVAAGRLKIIRAPRIATAIPISLVQRKRAIPSPAARALCEQLTAQAT